MKKLWILLLMMAGSMVNAQEPLYEKVIFSNSPMATDYYYSEATYETPGWIKNSSGKLTVTKSNFTPGNALELNYIAAPKGSWSAKVFYHDTRGIDSFKPAAFLAFWLFSLSETTLNQLPVVAISDRDKQSSGYLSLKNYLQGYARGKWCRVTIPLKDFKLPLDVRQVNVILFRQSDENSGAEKVEEHKVFIDQIELVVQTTSPRVTMNTRLISAIGFERHVDIVWSPVRDTNVKYVKIYRSLNNKDFVPVGIQSPRMSRYADYTGNPEQNYYYKITLLDGAYNESASSNVINAATRIMTDEQWLDMIQEANFRYYWEGAEINSGLSLENIPGRMNMVASGASGFGIMAMIVGVERKFITRDQAVERFDRITTFLEKAEKFHGAFPHFLDGPSGKAEPFFGANDNGGDLVETAFLIQGLLAAQQYFDKENDKEKTIRTRIQKLWEGVEWSWYRKTPDSKFLFWHWSPDKAWIINHKLIGWNETMITYLLAIASPTYAIPANMYYSGWASQSEEAQHYRSGWGKTDDGSLYKNGKTYYGVPLEVGVSTGGPLFFIHYSYMGMDPRKLKDRYTNYFNNNRNIALINYRYCIENPEKHRGYGSECWGLTASDGPSDYSANEPAPAADEGKITPTGALASFPYLPTESMAALRHFYTQYGRFLWGEYGFRDAFNLDENWCSEIYMGLNQAPIVVMIENHRTGLIWNLFMKNKDIQKGLEKLEKEREQ